VVFVLFGGEEMGLLGSKYFADHRPKQFDTIKAMINFDMVGEGDGAWCGYSSEPNWVKAILDSANSKSKIVKGSRAIREIGVSTSDFAPFFKKGIPCYSFYSNGPHLHYHQTGDTIFRINPDILTEIARIGFLCAFYTANL
jgi:Zn-dependent M28 family amino/carboxypeptidase